MHTGDSRIKVLTTVRILDGGIGLDMHLCAIFAPPASETRGRRLLTARCEDALDHGALIVDDQDSGARNGHRPNREQHKSVACLFVRYVGP